MTERRTTAPVPVGLTQGGRHGLPALVPAGLKVRRSAHDAGPGVGIWREPGPVFVGYGLETQSNCYLATYPGLFTSRMMPRC
jgi:hypothetical protein